jgi:hypothetical protein
LGEKILTRLPWGVTVIIVAAFAAGFATHLLYQRWNPSVEESQEFVPESNGPVAKSSSFTPETHRVSYEPFSGPANKLPEMPLLQARDVEKIRGLTGNQARIRGRVFRVGHSAKSNTYFLNFGPSREALTAVIFASTAELFEKNKLSPKNFDGREVELQGEIKNHPQYGLEVILESPSQIKVVN